MLTKLAGITEVARRRPKEKFTSLAHLINVDMLRLCHLEMDKNKATGIDEVTKEVYSENLEENLADLVQRLKRQAYHPQLVRRVYIPKLGSDKKRPLGIPMADRIAQMVAKIYFEPLVEPYFHADSYEYRPGKSPLNAVEITRKRCWQYKWVLEFDIVGLFDNIDH